MGIDRAADQIMTAILKRLLTNGLGQRCSPIKAVPLGLLLLFAVPCQARPGTAVEAAIQDARAAASGQRLFILKTQSRKIGQPNQTLVFYNSLQPFGFCYALTLNGDWEPGTDQQGGYFLADSRQSFLSFSIIGRQELSGERGGDAFAKATSLLARENAAIRDRDAPSKTLSAASRWLGHPKGKVLVWRAKLEGDQSDDIARFIIPANYLYPVADMNMLNIRVNSSLGVYREDEIARQLIDSFVVTQDAECFFPFLNKWLKD
ncbi:MAG: hypothetical protein VKM98_11005 [Cyanobacteriota bacterium]|nr:hypothetical protein [Cyanobacteriota bacterium]